MDREKTIDVLNKLVVINSDRIEGYQTASENTEEKDFKNLFSKFAQTSNKCRHELISEIQKLSGNAEEGTKVSGKFFRAWMDFKSALTSKDRKAILNSCEQGEEKAIQTYNTVFEENSGYLSTDLRMKIKTQYDLIRTDQGIIRTLQNASMESSK